MNGNSTISDEQRSSIHLYRKKLNNCFVKNNGKENSLNEKPLDTLTHCTMRLKWAHTHHFKLNNPFTLICYLDEKFCYTINRRQKVKKLPLGSLETPEDTNGIIPKILSRHFPINTMFMGVVWRPIPHRQFNGKIFL